MRHYSDKLDFISIVIPSYQRFHYLKECVESIHEYANMPFEIIVHDDNSNDGTREKTLSELKDKVSAIILNNGLQLGLSESINRCVKIASSNYIVMLNADCKIEYPIFKDIVDTLKCPFVGVISLMTAENKIDAMLVNDDTKFQLLRGIGSGCAQAFTQDAFEKIGGWYSHIVDSSNADVSFIVRMIKAGYFITSLNTYKSPVRNLSMDRRKCEDSTIARSYYDCSYPKLFNLHKSKYLKLFDIHKHKYELNSRVGDSIYAYLSRKRYENSTAHMQITYKAEEGDTNIGYWHNFMQKLIKDDYSIDIEVAKRCGHDKWIDEINGHRFKRDIS